MVEVVQEFSWCPFFLERGHFWIWPTQVIHVTVPPCESNWATASLSPYHVNSPKTRFILKAHFWTRIGSASSCGMTGDTLLDNGSEVADYTARQCAVLQLKRWRTEVFTNLGYGWYSNPIATCIQPGGIAEEIYLLDYLVDQVPLNRFSSRGSFWKILYRASMPTYYISRVPIFKLTWKLYHCSENFGFPHVLFAFSKVLLYCHLMPPYF